MSKALSTVNDEASRKIVRNTDYGLTGSLYDEQLSFMRLAWMQTVIDPRRDMERECGWPDFITTRQYRQMYDREGVATRVVSIYPDECWSVDPHVYENESDTSTPFELAWQDLLMSEDNNPMHYLHRVDVLSGIGRYGALLMGMSDDNGGDLSRPLPHINEMGEAVPGQPPLKLLYMRAFDETLCHIISYQRDPNNPRFGRPLYYLCLFSDASSNQPAAPGQMQAPVYITSKVVHWSRILHVADHRESSEVLAVPRQQPVFNRLCDIRKILGGSAEMFWKGGFPGYSLELDPSLALAGVQVDEASTKRQINQYENGLSRYLSLVGLHAKSLAPQVANPEGNLEVQLGAVAMSIGAPLRIFMGSEQAQLASGQDVRTWNRRLTRRQVRYITPLMIRPFIHRMIAFGVLPTPQEPSFRVVWPDINMPSEDDKSKIADRIASALYKYVTGGVYQVITPLKYLTVVCGIPLEIAKDVVKSMELEKGSIDITPPAITQAEESAKSQDKQPASGGSNTKPKPKRQSP